MPHAAIAPRLALRYWRMCGQLVAHVVNLEDQDMGKWLLMKSATVAVVKEETCLWKANEVFQPNKGISHGVAVVRRGRALQIIMMMLQ